MALRTDPTRTQDLRKRFTIDVDRRFRKLRADLNKLILEEDAFGVQAKKDRPLFIPGDALRNSTYGLVGLIQRPEPLGAAVTVANRWEAQTRPEQLASFRRWLGQRNEELGLSREDVRSPEWLRKYSEAAYERGHNRAYTDVRKTGSNLSGYQAGRKEEWMRAALGAPESVEKIEYLASRTFDDLKGITSAMSTQIGRELADGLAQGKNAREIARSVSDRVDKVGRTRAEMMARTEVIRAHAEGQLDGMKRLGVEEVGVEVEWIIAATACPICTNLQGVYKIDDARGLIPAHPNCRCAWAPFIPESILQQARLETAGEPSQGSSVQAPPGGGVSLMEKIRDVIRETPKTTEELMVLFGESKGKINSYMRGQVKLGKAKLDARGRWVLTA